MKAFRIAVGVSFCLTLTTGCTICQNPYHDCGPVWSRGTSQNCNPDHRAGSILNRQGVPATDEAVKVDKPAARAKVSAEIAAHRSDGSEPRDHSTTVAQQRQAPKPEAADRRTARTSPKSDVTREASSDKALPAGTVPAPPGTKEGDTRILSVTDRRLDELQRAPMPTADGPKSPKQVVEKPSEGLDGWRPAASHQDSLETASQVREIDR